MFAETPLQKESCVLKSQSDLSMRNLCITTATLVFIPVTSLTSDQPTRVARHEALKMTNSAEDVCVLTASV